jgi:cytochrome c biogenesis protein CcdA/thiol-disulfide isomerase/thioredoxin
VSSTSGVIVLVLAIVGVLAGLVTGLSPCILPVLPAIFVAGSAPPRATAGGDGTDGADGPPDPVAGPGTDGGSLAVAERTERAAARRRSRRPYLVIAGLVTSFSFFTLLGTTILTALGLPQDLLRTIGIVVLLVVGLGLIFERVGELLERPFTRIPQRGVDRNGSAFGLGLGLGLVFVPCAGPVLAAVTVVSATGEIGLRSVVLTVSFAIGVAIPLLAFALAGEQVATRVRAFRTRAALVRRVGGVLLVAIALALAFNLTDGLQRAIPGYTSALQNAIGSNQTAQEQLDKVAGRTASPELDACPEGSAKLESCGSAPELDGIEAFLNTPDGAPVSLAGERGNVVLVDFWTYSCINCQRTIPQLAEWNRVYEDAGLTVIGVHTPEFPFERVTGNVSRAADDLGVEYPVAIDNGYETWTAYGNRFWPSQYLVDAGGVVRHIKYGEGGYAETEELIRQLLVAADPGVRLPPATQVTDQTPTGTLTPETYLGYNRSDNNDGQMLAEGRTETYVSDGTPAPDSYRLDGTWTVNPQESTAGKDASLQLSFTARDVNLVIGGEGTATVSVDGGPERSIPVSGIPQLYELVDGDGDATDGVLTLTLSRGLSAYAFTFG